MSNIIIMTRGHYQGVTWKMTEPAKPILCLDFDGVLHSYTSGWTEADDIPDPPVDGAIQFVLEAAALFRVAIYSSRSHQEGGQLAMAQWLLAHGLPMEAFSRETQARFFKQFAGSFVPEPWEGQVYFPSEKPPAMVTIDDRAIPFTGVWPSMDTLKAFKPWNKQ